MITIICPTYNEKEYIAPCIHSLLHQKGIAMDPSELEIFFVDGLSTDGTREILQEFARDYPFIKIIDNPDRYVPFALNAAIKVARGEVIFRIDAHSEFPENYCSILLHQLKALNAMNVGGIIQTLPPRNTPVCRAIALALASPFGVGNAYFRIKAAADPQSEPLPMKVDTVPFGCFPKSVFETIGVFDTELLRNQDDEFNARIIRNGGSVYLIPTVSIQYFARDKVRKVMQMYYRYGLFKPLGNKKVGRAASIRQFFPPLFVVFLALAPVLGIIELLWHPQLQVFWCLYASIWLLYVLLGGVFAWRGVRQEAGRMSAKDILKIVMRIPWVAFCIHISYGWGYWTGLMKVTFGGEWKASSSR